MITKQNPSPELDRMMISMVSDLLEIVKKKLIAGKFIKGELYKSERDRMSSRNKFGVYVSFSYSGMKIKLFFPKTSYNHYTESYEKTTIRGTYQKPQGSACHIITMTYNGDSPANELSNPIFWMILSHEFTHMLDCQRVKPKSLAKIFAKRKQGDPTKSWKRNYKDTTLTHGTERNARITAALVILRNKYKSFSYSREDVISDAKILLKQKFLHDDLDYRSFVTRAAMLME